MLDESLQRLHAHLIDTAARSLPGSAARDAIRAFFGYYADRPTDFAGPVPVPRPGPRGLGAKWTSSSTAGCGTASTCSDRRWPAPSPWDAATIATEQMNTFTYLMGLLLLLHTHRLGQQADALLDQYCLVLEQR